LELEPPACQSNLAKMTRDGSFDFRPKLGRVRDRGGRESDSRSFVAQVMRAATKANGGPLKLAEMRGSGMGARESGPGREGAPGLVEAKPWRIGSSGWPPSVDRMRACAESWSKRGLSA
jgi:hypothetical protein